MFILLIYSLALCWGFPTVMQSWIFYNYITFYHKILGGTKDTVSPCPNQKLGGSCTLRPCLTLDQARNQGGRSPPRELFATPEKMCWIYFKTNGHSCEVFFGQVWENPGKIPSHPLYTGLMWPIFVNATKTKRCNI